MNVLRRPGLNCIRPLQPVGAARSAACSPAHGQGDAQGSPAGSAVILRIASITCRPTLRLSSQLPRPGHLCLRPIEQGDLDNHLEGVGRDLEHGRDGVTGHALRLVEVVGLLSMPRTSGPRSPQRPLRRQRGWIHLQLSQALGAFHEVDGLLSPRVSEIRAGDPPRLELALGRIPTAKTGT